MTRSRFNLHKTFHKYQLAITWQAIWNEITWSEMGKQTIQAKKVYSPTFETIMRSKRFEHKSTLNLLNK